MLMYGLAVLQFQNINRHTSYAYTKYWFWDLTTMQIHTFYHCFLSPNRSESTHKVLVTN